MSKNLYCINNISTSTVVIIESRHHQQSLLFCCCSYYYLTNNKRQKNKSEIRVGRVCEINESEKNLTSDIHSCLNANRSCRIIFMKC